MNAEQKIAKTLIALKEIRPFYGAVFEVLVKAPGGCETLAVSANKLYYNENFIEKTEFSGLLFHFLHALSHVALQHGARMEGRDPVLYNAAADLYVNKLLGEEFWLKPGKSTTIAGYAIDMPEDLLYLEDLDLTNDYVEKIYDHFLLQSKKNGYQASKFSGSGEGHEFGYGKGSATVKFFLCRDTPGDLSVATEDPGETAMKANQLLSTAFVRMEIGGGAGAYPGKLMAIAREIYYRPVHYKHILSKYLREAASKDSTFARPDKRMYWQKAIYPGQLSPRDEVLRDLKICIDTSKSISDDAIALFCSQIATVLGKFNFQAELIFWDAVIQRKENFSTVREFKNILPTGRGGTNPGCLFRYFDSRQCRVKPLLILVYTDGQFPVQWAGANAQWRKTYKNTLWILSENSETPQALPFGKIIKA